MVMDGKTTDERRKDNGQTDDRLRSEGQMTIDGKHWMKRQKTEGQ